MKLNKKQEERYHQEMEYERVNVGVSVKEFYIALMNIWNFQEIWKSLRDLHILDFLLLYFTAELWSMRQEYVPGKNETSLWLYTVLWKKNHSFGLF